MKLRLIIAEDADALAAIHASSFPAAWRPDDFARFLQGSVTFGRAAETDDGQLAGFVLCRIIAGEAEILTIAVAPAHRRQGVAVLLLAEVMAIASVRAEAMFLEVAADNPGAIALYDGLGFEAVGRRAGYYGRPAGGSVDAIVMRRSLGEGRSGA